MTTHATIATNPDIKAKIPGLAHQAALIGDEAVRHRGTMGGSLANNDPAACYPSALLALGGTIKTDRRSIAADDFFQGMFTTALEPGEIITSIDLPIPEKSAYEKFRNPASRYAIVGVFVAKFPAGVRLAITGASQGGVFRHTEMETALSGQVCPRRNCRDQHTGGWVERRYSCQCRISCPPDWRRSKTGSGESRLNIRSGSTECSCRAFSGPPHFHRFQSRVVI